MDKIKDFINQNKDQRITENNDEGLVVDVDISKDFHIDTALKDVSVFCEYAEFHPTDSWIAINYDKDHLPTYYNKTLEENETTYLANAKGHHENIQEWYDGVRNTVLKNTESKQVTYQWIKPRVNDGPDNNESDEVDEADKSVRIDEWTIYRDSSKRVLSKTWGTIIMHDIDHITDVFDPNNLTPALTSIEDTIKHFVNFMLEHQDNYLFYHLAHFKDDPLNMMFSLDEKAAKNNKYVMLIDFLYHDVNGIIGMLNVLLNGVKDTIKDLAQADQDKLLAPIKNFMYTYQINDLENTMTYLSQNLLMPYKELTVFAFPFSTDRFINLVRNMLTNLQFGILNVFNNTELTAIIEPYNGPKKSAKSVIEALSKKIASFKAKHDFNNMDDMLNVGFTYKKELAKALTKKTKKEGI